MDFKEWVPLKLVDSDLLSRVRLAYVFGKSGQEAFIITQNDDVYACGPNFSGCLGLENEGPQVKPVRVPELCQQEVKGFSSSVHENGVFVCSYTSQGKIYCWGKSFSEIAVFYNKPCSYHSCVNDVDESQVLEVVAGPNHCCVLTKGGKIFTFGLNNCGQLGRPVHYDDDRARLVGGDLKSKKVVTVSCGTDFSIALLDNKQVFAWGRNNHGQLGLGFVKPNTYVKLPTRIVKLENIKIEKIICGKSYVLAVSDTKELYLWGQNDVGQLGLGDTTSRYEPKMMEKIGRVIDIAASCYGSTTAVMTESNVVYMWGACGELNLTEPTRTEFESVFHVFAYFANPRVMPVPMTRPEGVQQINLVSECIKNAFGKAETSDLTVVVEGKKILVHKLILTLRSPYFKVMLKEPWLKKNQKVLKIDQNYKAMYAYFQYIYSGKLEASSEVAFELWKISDEYHDLVLKKTCEKIIRYGVTIQNFHTVYNMASKLGAKELATFCMSFAGKHVGELIKSPGYAQWDAETCKGFISQCHEQRLFKD